MDKASFTEHLARERRARGYTQKQIAETLGVSNRTYSKWETGENEMDVSTLCRLAEFYGISPAAFFTETESGPLLRQKLAALPFPEAALCCHEWMEEMYLGLFENTDHQGMGDPAIPPPERESWGTSLSEYPGGVLFLRHTGADANLHVYMMPSKEGCGWLRSEAEDIAAFFSLLQSPRLLEPLVEPETNGRWDYYTAEHLAERAGLSPADAERALEALVRRNLCRRVEVRTAGGDKRLYTRGETRLLRAILTLVHLIVNPNSPKGDEGK